MSEPPKQGIPPMGRGCLPDHLICIVDDDASMRLALANLMRSSGYRVALFSSAESFLVSGSAESAACIVTDIQMPGQSGFDLKEALDRLGMRAPVIMITARKDDTLRRRAYDSGAVSFFNKPFNGDVLLQHVSDAIKRA